MPERRVFGSHSSASAEPKSLVRGTIVLMSVFPMEDDMTLATTLIRSSSRAAHPILVLVAMSLGVLVAQIDTSVVSLAVKKIGADLNSGVSQMQWVIDA